MRLIKTGQRQVNLAFWPNITGKRCTRRTWRPIPTQPSTIARQKLLNAVGEEFCEENGLTFTKVNPSPELVQAREDYVADLFAQARGEITYYNGAG